MDREAAETQMKALYKKCIEIIYERVNEGEWGTEKTQRHINNLFQDAM